MQAIKHFDISKSSTETINRRAYPNGSNFVIWVGCDEINEKIAEFLNQCGVEASYTIREEFDSEYKYIWIGNTTMFLRKASDSSAPMLYINDHSHTDGISIFDGSAMSGYMNFIGNPKTFWCLRFFTNFMGYVDGFFFGHADAPVSGVSFPIRMAMESASANFYTIKSDGLFSYAATTLQFLRHSVDTTSILYKYFSNNEKILTPIMINGPHVNVYPANAEIPVSSSVSALFQKEVLINGKKYMILDSDSSGSFNKGILQLEDDDPLVSEEDLLAEVNS